MASQSPRGSSSGGETAANLTALHLQQHQLKDGVNEITIIVNEPPAFVAVDPRVLRIDKNRFTT